RLQHVLVIWRALASRPRFDLALDLQGTLRSAAWIYLSRARWRAGFGSPRPGWQVSLTAGPATHAVENCAAAPRALGVAVEALAPRLYCYPSAAASAGQILRQHGVPQTGFVVLNPFSRWPSKEWPMERWAEVARCLEAEFGQTVVITGAADEAIRARGLTQTCSGGAIVSLVGNLTLEQAMSVYRRARLMISGDSGPMHVAAALGTPLLALFGPTWPERSGPWGQRDAVLQARRPPTHHTYRHDPEGCYIRGLPVSSVLAKLRGLLGASLYSTLA
ncbi:MAG: glycosyltransferase family 9 protein, partial [Gemmataceae bacterium]